MWCEIRIQFQSSARGCLVFWTQCIEETIFLHCIFLAPLLKIRWHRCMDLFLGYSVSLLLFLFHWFYVSVFMPVPYCSGYYSFVIHCEIKECDASTLCSFSSLLWLCEVFCGSIQILGLFFLFLWKISLEFDRDFTESVGHFGYYERFNSINSSNPWAQNIFPLICVFFNFFPQCFIVLSIIYLVDKVYS